MSTGFSRTLSFQSNGLDEEATLLLVFGGDKVTGMFHDVFPVCWRVFKFGKKEPYHLTITYTNKFSFIKPEMERAADIIVDAYTFKHLNVGQATTLLRNGQGLYAFTDPVKGTDGHLTITNGAPLREDVSLGFDEPTSTKRDTPISVFYFTHIGSKDSDKVQFNPMLHGYIVNPKDYQNGQVVRQVIDPALKVWESDLTNLAAQTTWNVTYDDKTGRFKIAQNN